jgi:hypothetical protein
MFHSTRTVFVGLFASALTCSAVAAHAGDSDNVCAGLPTHQQLKVALESARAQSNGGFNLDMWGTVVNRDGIVCAVAFTGTNRGSQWPGSRAISAQKANTANAFSLPGLALSTANLYAAVQPGGTLYGLQASNPVDTDTAYRGPAADFGENDDPMVGRRIGGVNVFGGGLACTTRRSSCSAESVSAATHPVRTTTSPGAPATIWRSTGCRAASARRATTT